ncbi:MAG: hypothetical protein ACRCZ0_07685 [Cetobacterium sp.]
MRIKNIEDANQGAQGYIKKYVLNDQPVVIKFSNHIDFVLELEEEVWERLKLFNSIHFCKVFTKTSINPGERRYQLVFKEITHYEPKNSISLRNQSKSNIRPVKATIIKNKNDSLANLLYDAKHKVVALMNCLNQTLAAIIMYQNVGITHYDLHVDNVMITNTEYDVHVYKLKNNIIAIKTFGLSPVIIDFGMAYVPNNRYNATCMFANNGFTTFMPDHHVDARLLLVTALKDLEHIVKDYKKNSQNRIEKLKTPKSIILKDNKTVTAQNIQSKVENIKISELYIKKIKAIYGNLKIQENGWFHDNCFNNIINEIVNMMPKILNQRKGGVFKKNNLDWTFELLQHEIQIPLKTPETFLKFHPTDEGAQLSKVILLFAAEWVYVEQIIRNTKEEQLFLKDLVSMDESLKSYCIMRHRYPKIKNLKKLKNYCKTSSEIFSHLLNNYRKKIEVKKSLIYSRMPYKTTEDILISLPKQSIKYEKNMKLNFIDTSGSQQSFNLTINDIMVTKLNENEQETFQEIFKNNDLIKI